MMILASDPASVRRLSRQLGDILMTKLARSSWGRRQMRADRIGRLIMAVVVLLTLLAFADGLRRMSVANVDRIWVETWRTFAYVVFAGLFAILASKPRSSPGVWELTWGHKTAVVLVGLWLGNEVPEVSLAVRIDFLLVVLIVVAWVLCRGWLSWSSKPPVSPMDSRVADVVDHGPR
jgi:hypothetical protein